MKIHRRDAEDTERAQRKNKISVHPPRAKHIIGHPVYSVSLR